MVMRVGGRNSQGWGGYKRLVFLNIMDLRSLTALWPLIGDGTPPPIIFEHITEGRKPVKEEEEYVETYVYSDIYLCIVDGIIISCTWLCVRLPYIWTTGPKSFFPP